MENQNGKPQAKEKIKQGTNEMLSGLFDFFHDWLDLKHDLDRPGTVTNIQNNIRMRGANAWLLVCSIMVASLGLNLNSPAVIIGAMLISPLMSPILGIGLGIGINDRAGLWVAVQHFGMSVAIALVTSFLYFWLTPIDEYTHEIAARTEPGILDVLVAVFGGLAGIISGSRTDKSNAIPGVAIATALMPPLCVTGYGLAHGDWSVTFNSFYLFFMNATFIALTTYLLVSFMNFPKKKYETKRERVRTRRLLGFFAILMLLPSIFIFSSVLQSAQEQQKIVSYVNKQFPDSILDTKKKNDSDSLSVKIFLFEDISDEKIEEYYQDLQTLNCRADYTIIDAQGSGISKQEYESATRTLQESILSQVEIEKKAISSKKDLEIAALQSHIDSLNSDTVIFKAASKELRVLYPLLEEVRYAQMQTIGADSTDAFIPTFLMKWSSKKTQKSRNRDEQRIKDFLLMRKSLDTLQILRF